jgi:hypothetical protein
MTLDVYLAGERIELDPRRSIGKGGEADVYDVGRGRALKIFKTSDHPDYDGLSAEQKAADARIAEHQTKLREFPKSLPSGVIAPERLATDRAGRSIVGYEMALVPNAEPLLRFADASFRRGGGISSARVIDLFRSIHSTLSGIHAAGVIVGDLNDLNILVSKVKGPRFIDADSYQFGRYRCSVFTDRFVDPKLCLERASSLRLARPFNAGADWYAFAVLLMQSLLFVGPYGGVHRPKDPAKRIAHGARPLHRITVFHPEVQYPKPAVSPRVLSDDLREHFHRVFEKDERGPFPLSLLERLEFQLCPSCGAEHARPACPLCCPNGASPAKTVTTVRGAVTVRRVFETSGVILAAAIDGHAIRFVHHERGAFHREGGEVLFKGELDPALRFAVAGNRTLVGRGGEVVTIEPGKSPTRTSVDACNGTPQFAADERHRYWIAGGRLHREPLSISASSMSLLDPVETIGEVLEGQTRFWVGSTFGVGFYRAGNVSVAFAFDSTKRGICDGLDLPPLRGELVAASCAIDRERAWLMLALQDAGRTSHTCLVYSKAGALEAMHQGDAHDGSWLGTIGGQCATGGVLLAPTDGGIVRVEVDAGAVQMTREFPDTEPFVDGDTRLLAGERQLYAIGRRTISGLTIR